MNQETLIQIIILLILVILSMFYNPLSATFEGKIIFFGIIILVVLFFVIFDVYNEINNNKIRIKLFDDKWKIAERVKKIEKLQGIENDKNK